VYVVLEAKESEVFREKIIVFPFQLNVPVGVAPFIRNAPCADDSSIASLKFTKMVGKIATSFALSAGVVGDTTDGVVVLEEYKVVKLH
jgi:hypothetical protein